MVDLTVEQMRAAMQPFYDQVGMRVVDADEYRSIACERVGNHAADPNRETSHSAMWGCHECRAVVFKPGSLDFDTLDEAVLFLRWDVLDHIKEQLRCDGEDAGAEWAVPFMQRLSDMMRNNGYGA